MNFWTAMVAIVGIAGIVQIVRYKIEARKSDVPPEDPEARETIRRLEDRVLTLERIVTDDKETLKRRIDEL
jgi:uncharacterized protein (UPF0297 family)